MKEISEDRLQADCFQWLHNNYPDIRGLCWHVPNGGKRAKREANKFKAMGLVPGVPDLEFHYAGKSYFFELKTPTGTQSTVQKKVQAALEGQGFNYYLVRSKEQFQNLIKKIIA